LGSTKPASRHEGVCPVYQGWLDEMCPECRRSRREGHAAKCTVAGVGFTPLLGLAPVKEEGKPEPCPDCGRSAGEPHMRGCPEGVRPAGGAGWMGRGRAFVVGEVCRTRDGRVARVICVDAAHDRFPVIALVKENDGSERTVWVT